MEPSAEAEADGWFSGPPYAIAESVFDEDDMKACVPHCSHHSMIRGEL